MSAGNVQLVIAPEGDDDEAAMVFKVGEGMKVGYRGYYRCDG
ncbi:hypothetical protein ABID21_004880 [Pseudorhizobium tarimense]|uniref:Uncharacterized protein n=1 Tax=Pseudorhizobium tarimense TaxID=1079109 RepID=A0ABV2HET7_9HYPH|nr:hypothetical protein [Pseudorhizobium tarimense]